jgi:hypothetical protein
MRTLYIFLTLVLLSCESQDSVSDSWEKLGKIKPKSTKEISTSMLWIGGEVLDRDLCDYDAYKEYLDDLGAKKIRLQSGWAKTEKEKGKYDFSWLDHIVDDAISRGLQPWIQISYGNLIYEGGGGVSLSAGLPSSEEALEAWYNYTKALVNRYKDRVNEWEIWNEADHGNNLKFGSDEYTYARLFVKTVEAIKSEQPKARIVALSLAGVGNTEYVDGFFGYLQEHGDVNWVDVITFHGYPENPDNGFDAVEKLKSTVSKYNPNVEFWQGETGCPSTLGSTGALKNHEWTEHTQAKWDMRRALAHIGRGYNFSLFLISEFIYNDAQRKGLNSKGILKINEEDLSVQYPKPAYYAYQNLCTVFGRELEVINNLKYQAVTDSSLSVFAWKDFNGQPIIAYWKDDEIPEDKDSFFNINLEVNGLNFTEPVLLNPYNGEVKAIPKRAIVKENNRVVFSGIPAWDSPYIILEKGLVEVETSF